MSTSFEAIRVRNLALADTLLGLISGDTHAPVGCAPSELLHGADAIVAHIEVNDHHGVGVLLQRLFGTSNNILSIRSKEFYGGKQDFGAMHVCIAHGDLSRDMRFWNVLGALGGAAIRRIVCVPYFCDDALTAIALKEIFGVPLCTYLMDDQNICTEGIPDSVMRELLAKSSLRLAISPEMCTAYEAKFGCKIWFMPPVAPTQLIPQRLNQLPDQALRETQPIIVGNIWGQQWLESLRTTVRGTGTVLRWYNNGQFPWLSCSKEALIQDGIVPQEGPPEPDDTFVQTIRQAPFVVVPTGTLEKNDDRSFIAQLSFPSRIPYILATSHTPILVIGNPETPAARIVTRFKIGLVVPYERRAFLDAVQHMTQPDLNLAMRRSAFRLSLRFADLGAAEWIWESLQKGEPMDGRYEDLMPNPRPDPAALLAANKRHAG